MEERFLTIFTYKTLKEAKQAVVSIENDPDIAFRNHRMWVGVHIKDKDDNFVNY